MEAFPQLSLCQVDEGGGGGKKEEEENKEKKKKKTLHNCFQKYMPFSATKVSPGLILGGKTSSHGNPLPL